MMRQKLMSRKWPLASWVLMIQFATAFCSASSVLAPVPLIKVTNAPPVQMFAPGFTVRELPLELNNVNTLVYAPDGRLFALCYDGDVFQLKDTDGDGLEDTATIFFKNDKHEVTGGVGGAWGPGGLYLATRGRIVRLRDGGNGTAKLETVTDGWALATSKEGYVLDAYGVAVDKSGNIFFGLGTDDWMHPYRDDLKPGVADYNLLGDRGTVQEVGPDGKNRHTVATGIRFTVSMAFNANGDLFATDQEGATWLPNGNPFDELLQIKPAKHYGFPPRHPKYLPDVIDEPSVFDYAPQHQSACGLHFDEPFPTTGKIFGPPAWRGDAIVTGESRGKLFRTKLVKTAYGYVAQNNLIACLNMLTVDATPTPQGDLLVACHSGLPDWGSGPEGKGKLFKISWNGKTTPQPLFAYAASPTETRVVFDHAVDLVQFKTLQQDAKITMGKYAVAGERFEAFIPGYQAVADQHAVPQYQLSVLSAAITGQNSNEQNVIALETAPRDIAVNYAITLPEGSLTNRLFDTNRHELPQFAAIDFLSDLTGVEAVWRPANERNLPAQHAWLPHMDLEVAAAFTTNDPAHARFFKALEQLGTVTLRSQLDISQMLHPAIQPGAKLDFSYPPEMVTVVIRSHARVTVASDVTVNQVSAYEVRLTMTGEANQWLPLAITLAKGSGKADLEISWFTDEDPTQRAFPLRRFLLPWAKPYLAEPQLSATRAIPQIAGGDWVEGKKVFFGEKVACYKCHQVSGEGGKIGPDLSNLVYRDCDSVMKDITQPNAAINPDHIAYNIELKDGEIVTGVILNETATNIAIGQASGQSVVIERANIANLKASSLSLMPEGLLQALTAQQQKDLLTFLLMPKEAGKK